MLLTILDPDLGILLMPYIFQTLLHVRRLTKTASYPDSRSEAAVLDNEKLSKEKNPWYSVVQQSFDCLCAGYEGIHHFDWSAHFII